MVGIEDRSAVGEEEIAHGRVDEVYEVEDVQVQLGRQPALHEDVQERQEAYSDREYRKADPPIDLAVEAEVRADKLAVVVRDRLVH